MKITRPSQSGGHLQKKEPAGKKQEVKKNPLVYLVVIAAWAFIIYGQSLRFEFAMDDNIMIRLNKSVQKGLGGFQELFTHSMVFGSNGRNDGAYRPLTMMSFAADKQFFGNKPAPFHFINVLLYACTGVILLLLLFKLFPAWHPFFPFVTVMLFMSHPVHTEVVANIKSRDEILSFLFAMLSLLALFRKAAYNRLSVLATAFILFLLACLSKETALAFVVIAPLTFYFFTSLKGKEIFIKSIPFIAGALSYMILRMSFLTNVGSATQIKIIDNTLMAANGAGEKYATIIFITWKYLALLIFPHPLSWDYSYNEIPVCQFSDLRTLLPLLLFLAMGCFAMYAFRKKNIFSWCILFFFGTLALVSNIFIPIAATMAERFLYFPSLAYCIALVSAIILLLKTDTSKLTFSGNSLFILLTGSIIFTYTIKSYSRAGDWKNNLALFESGVKSAPNSTRTHSALAYEYAVQAEQSKNPDLQKSFYDKSIAEFKTSLSIYQGNKEGWYNIAHTYDIMGEYDEAATYYKKAIEIDPGSANAYNNLGAIYLRKNKYEEAKELFRKAIQLDKNYADPYGNLGAAYHFQNNYSEAIRYYEQALAINPGLQTVLNNLTKAKESLRNQSVSKTP
jgi:tetratricopeptide (TPR) repeat protein